jgi:hypothetical protein
MKPMRQIDSTKRRARLTFQFVLCAILAIFFTACADPETRPSTDLPSVDYECNAFQAVACDLASENKPAFAGLIREVNVGCRELLSFLAADQLTQQFDYSSWTQNQNTTGPLSQGTFTHWVNHAHYTVINIPREKYKICSFIDVNENGRADEYEPLGEMTFTPGESFLPLTNWTNF